MLYGINQKPDILISLEIKL